MIDFARYLNIRSAIMPAPSPDGRRVAFLSDITGNYQVWSVGQEEHPAAAWPVQLTFFADKVWELHGTGAATHLLAVGDVGGNERQQFYLIDGFGAAGDQAPYTVRRLTTNDQAIHRFGAWSSDGQAIVFTSNARNNVDFDLYWMDLAGGRVRAVAETSGNRTIVAWSPDDATVLMLDAVATEETELYAVELETGAHRHVTAAAPAARYEDVAWTERGIYLLSDREQDGFALCRLDPATAALEPLVTARELLDELGETAGELEHLAVTGDGRQAALSLNADGYNVLYLLDLQDGRRRQVDGLEPGVVANMTFDAGGQALYFDWQNPANNANLYRVEWQDGALQQLTYSNRAGVAGASFVRPETIRFTTFDGLSIPAFFYTPQTPAPADGYPCILYVHGGPAGQQRPDFDVRFQYFLARGFALLVTNVRGSTGYGRTYTMLDNVEKRMDSVADLKAAVQWLQEEETVDHSRIAIYGRSYGGFMVLAALTEYPELFAAGIDVVGIANWVTFMERTSPWRRPHREREYGSLAHHRDLLERLSPIHKAERITMPLLVVAGDNDPRVPLFESEQVVERVRNAGGHVEFLHYADEGHKISKLANRIDSFTRMADFLARTIGHAGEEE